MRKKTKRKLQLLLLCCSCFVFSARAQDTIHFVNGTVKAVKVEEIGSAEIRYHRFENVPGPLYVVSKQEIAYVRFANGQVETIGSQKPATAPSFSPIQSNRINIRRKSLSYNGRPLYPRGLHSMIKNYPKPDVKIRLETEYKNMIRYRVNSSVLRTVGLVVGIGAPVVGTLLLLNGGGSPGVGFAIGAAVGIPCSVFAKINENKSDAKKIEIANIYNDAL